VNLRYSRPLSVGPTRARPGPLRIGASFVLVLALLAGAGIGARLLLDRVWDNVVGYQSPFAKPLPLEPSFDQAPTGSVVLFVIDGLRVDTSRKLENLTALRREGVSLVALAEQPSLSLSGAATMATGTVPYVHGVTTNWYEGPIMVDNMFAAVRRAGLPTAFVGWEGWRDLYGAHLTHVMIPGPHKDTPGLHDQQVRDMARAYLEEAGSAPPGLTVVYFSGTDDVGHSHGGASAEYLAEAHKVDRYLGELLALLDLGRVTVLVTSDHGHIDSGGHGGWEPVVLETPLVLAGNTVKLPRAADEAGGIDGVWPLVRQTDIAPSIAALLGARVPAHSLGTFLSDWMTGDDAWRAERMVSTAVARARLSAILTGIGTPASVPAAVTEARSLLAQADHAGALQVARDYLQAEATERARVRAGQLTSQQSARLPRAALAMIAPLLVLLLMAKPPQSWRTLLAAALFFGLFYGTYAYIRGLTYSFSAFNSEEQIMAFISMRLLEGAGFMVLTGLLGGLMTRNLDFGARVSVGLGALLTSLLVLWGLGGQIVWYYYQQGLVYADYLPDFRMAFKALVYLLTATGAGLAAIPTVLLALGAGGLGATRRLGLGQRRYR